MRVPGSNLMNMASRVISLQTWEYYQFLGRTTNAKGIDVAQRSPAIPMKGSAQAVPRNVFEKLGLDFQANYMNFFVAANYIDIRRDTSGDQIRFAGKLYNVLSKTEWYAIDGWVEVLAIEVNDDGSDTNTYVITPGTEFVVEP